LGLLTEKADDDDECGEQQEESCLDDATGFEKVRGTDPLSPTTRVLFFQGKLRGFRFAGGFFFEECGHGLFFLRESVGKL